MTWRGRRRAEIAAHAFLVAATIAFEWAAVRHLSTRPIGTGGDSSNVLWSWHHMANAVVHGHQPFLTKALFFPVGVDLAFHTFAPGLVVLLTPVVRWAGTEAAYNLAQLAATYLSFLGAFLLARRLGASRWAAVAGALAYGMSAYRVLHIGEHPTLVHTEILPFGVLVLLRLLDRPSRWRALLLGAVVGGAWTVDAYLTVFLVATLGIVALFRRSELRRDVWRLVPWAVGAALVVSAPLAVAQVRALQHHELGSLPGFGGADVFSADAVAFFLRSEQARFHLGDPLHSIGGRNEVYLGWTVLVVIAAAWRRLGPQRRLWLWLAIVSAVLAMGPFLKIAGRSGSVLQLRGAEFALPLPWLAVTYLPLLSSLRAPARWVVVSDLALAMLFALALSRLGERRRWVIPVVTAALVLDLLPAAFPTIPPPGRAYERLASSHDNRSVLELPLQWSTGTRVVGDTRALREDSVLLRAALVHHHPLVNGSMARYPDRRLAALLRVPVYRQVLALEGEAGFADTPVFGAEDLAGLGIGWVVYHRDRPVPAALAYVEGLRLPVLADDGVDVIWRVPESTRSAGGIRPNSAGSLATMAR